MKVSRLGVVIPAKHHFLLVCMCVFHCRYDLSNPDSQTAIQHIQFEMSAPLGSAAVEIRILVRQARELTVPIFCLLQPVVLSPVSNKEELKGNEVREVLDRPSCRRVWIVRKV